MLPDGITEVQLKDNKPISRRKQQYYPGPGIAA